MKHTRKLQIGTAAMLGSLALCFFTACTSVYFETPVPKGARDATTVPADWDGVYVTEPDPGEDVGTLDQLVRLCLRFERLSDTRLLVSADYRIYEKDMPRFRAHLEEKKKAGELIDYQLSAHAIISTVPLNDDERPGAVEQQYTGLIKQGQWYVLAQTVSPFRQFDVAAGTMTEYESELHNRATMQWLPAADSLTAKTPARLVARTQQHAWYFNLQEPGETKWSLLYVTKPSKDKMVVKLSTIDDRNAFEQRLDELNAITPFRKVSGERYEIDPSDAALARLLNDAYLLETTTLRKISAE